MNNRRKKIFDKVIKNGKNFFTEPIFSIFLLENINEKTKNLSSVNLIGIIVKKKILKNQLIGIK